MKKFSIISKLNEIDLSVKPDTISSDMEKLIESILNISVDGDLDAFMSKDIEIEGKEKLVEQIENYINILSLKVSEDIMESIRYNGVKFVEDKLINESKKLKK